MGRSILWAIPAAAAVLFGGCADLMTRSTIAPEWFQAKAVEVKGEGYPSLGEIPEQRGEKSPSATAWQADKDALQKQAKDVEAAAVTIDIPLTDEQIRARAAQLRALTEKNGATQP